MLGALAIQSLFQQAARTLGRRRVSTLVSVGARLGRYEIRSQIGAGGMDEVYLAQDTKLDRKARAPMKLGEVLDAAVQIASGLSAAHAAGIVRHDIKPENIMIRHE